MAKNGNTTEMEKSNWKRVSVQGNVSTQLETSFLVVPYKFPRFRTETCWGRQGGPHFLQHRSTAKDEAT